MGWKRFGFSNSVLVIRLFEEHTLCCKPSSPLEKEEEEKKRRIKEVVLWL